MNKAFEDLIDRVRTWPAEAQNEAMWALRSVEFRHVESPPPLTDAERDAKLTALRLTINESIERGGSYTDEEVAASVEQRLDAWERKQKSE